MGAGRLRRRRALTKIMFTLANGLVEGSVPKMPSCANSDFQPVELMSNLSVWYLSVHDSSS